MSKHQVRSRRSNRGVRRQSPVAVETLEGRRLLAAGPYQFDGGRLTVEAEHFDDATTAGGHMWSQVSGGGDVGPSMQAQPDTQALIDGDFARNSPRLSYLFDASVGGTYYVWVRGRAVAGDEGNSDSLHVGIGGQTATSDRITGFGSTFGWSNATMDGPRATVQVPVGDTYALSAYMREDGFTLDRILLTNDPNYVPTGAGPAESGRGDAGTDAGPSVTGSLANPDPLAGPLALRFDDTTAIQSVLQVVPLADGRFYSFGSAGDAKPYVVRHLADGQIDRSFGTNGRLAATGALQTVAQQDGTIVTPVTGGFLIRGIFGQTTRVNADLGVVATYGTGGVVSPGADTLTAARGDGSLLVLRNDFLYRYDADGKLQQTTAVPGFATLADPAGNPYYARRLAVGEDGSGYVVLESRRYVGVLKVRANLTVDTTYGGGDGLADKPMAVAGFGTFDDRSVAVSADGRVAFVENGRSADPVTLSVLDAGGAVAVRNAVVAESGSFPNDFAYPSPQFVRFLADGDVLVAYRTSGGTRPSTFGFGRFNADGTVDRARDFRQGSTASQVPTNLRIDFAVPGPDNTILYSGFTFTNAATENFTSAIFKASAGPVVAPPTNAGFGTDGKVLVAFPGSNYVKFQESVPAPGGGVFLIGDRGNVPAGSTPLFAGQPATPTPANPQAFVVKLKADGSFDNSFSGDGVAPVSELDWPREITGLKPAPGGGFLGTFGSNDLHQRVGNTLVKLDGGFRLDTGFGGGDGIAELSSFGPFDVRPDGKIVFAGLPFGSPGYVELYNADGSLVNGSRRNTSSLFGRDLGVLGVTAGPDNTAFLVGEEYLDAGGSPKVYSLAKVTPALALSAGFATNGVKRATAASSEFLGSNSVFVGPQGQSLWVFSEDDGETTLVPSDPAGKTLTNGPATGTGLSTGFRLNPGTPDAPYSIANGFSPDVLDVGFAADGGFTVASVYQTDFGPVAYNNGEFGANAFSLSKFKADGSVDGGFGQGGRLGVFSRGRPVQINDADAVTDGRFFVAGGDDASTFGTVNGQPAVTQFGFNGSVRLLSTGATVTPPPPPTDPGTAAPELVDFEAVPLGKTDAAGFETKGFRFVNVDGGGSVGGTLAFNVYGTANGFSSRVIQPTSYGRSVVITRPDGKTFDLTSFDYAGSIYGDGGDFVVTGTFANGTTQVVNQAFGGSKAGKTLALNWTGLTKVSVNYAGGVNAAYGTLDNFRFGTATTPPPTGNASGFVVEAENTVRRQGGKSSTWQTVAGGVGGAGGAIQALPDTNQLRDGFADYAANSPRADYALTLPTAGRYYVWVRGRGVAGDVGNSNSIHVGLNGGRVATAEQIDFGSDTFAWSNRRLNGERAYLDIDAGGNVVVSAWMREDGVSLDRLLLTKNPNYVPTGDGPPAGALA